jgi:putative redox protein
MVTIKTTYLGSLRTTSQHLQSGNQLITDAPTDNHGKGESFSPTDLVCTSLCTCMMTIMGINARKYNVDLSGMDAEVTKTMQGAPRKIKRITIAFSLPEASSIEPATLSKLKEAALTCPVALSLNPDIEQDIHFAF